MGRTGARLPEWQLVPGTRFVVDKFGSKASEAAPNTRSWFLTHFHADHYGGLGPRFKQGELPVLLGQAAPKCTPALDP